MMIKQLIIGRVLPLGLAGLFLQSSVSPIRPALNAFAAATDALAGRSSDHVEANFPGTAGAPPVQLPSSPEDVKGGIAKALGSLFGSSHKDDARAQLDGIINDVKYHGHPPPEPSPQTSAPQRNAQQPGQAPTAKPGREVQLTKTKKK